MCKAYISPCSEDIELTAHFLYLTTLFMTHLLLGSPVNICTYICNDRLSRSIADPHVAHWSHCFLAMLLACVCVCVSTAAPPLEESLKPAKIVKIFSPRHGIRDLRSAQIAVDRQAFTVLLD